MRAFLIFPLPSKVSRVIFAGLGALAGGAAVLAKAVKDASV